MSAKEFKELYFNALLNLLWRQWSRLGIAGQIATGKSPYVLDPEALLLFSAWFCRYDQRLYDLFIDWLRINGVFINLQRLKTLSKNSTYKDDASLGFIAAQVNISGERKWKKFADELLAFRNSEVSSMFLSPDQNLAVFHRETDETALKYGFARNPYISSGKVSQFPTAESAGILLQMRGVFGLSARAETILALLNKDVCKIQDIADISGFAWKSIQDVLMELSATPLLTIHGSGKRGRYYSLKSPEKIRGLFEAESFLFPDWRRIYNALGALWKTVSNPRLSNLSEQTFKFEIKRVFEDEIGKTFLDAGIGELKFMNADEIADLPTLLEKI